MRTPRPASIGLIGVLLVSGCAVAAAATLPTPAPMTLSAIAVRNVDVSTTFSEAPGIAVTYDPALVPVGSRVAVSAKSADGTTTVRLALRGLQTARRYGAHVHEAPCGADRGLGRPDLPERGRPDAAQRRPAVREPAERDLARLHHRRRRGGQRAGHGRPWGSPPTGAAHSVVIHAWPTATAAGKAGTAGDRVACVTVDF